MRVNPSSNNGVSPNYAIQSFVNLACYSLVGESRKFSNCLTRKLGQIGAIGRRVKLADEEPYRIWSVLKLFILLSDSRL